MLAGENLQLGISKQMAPSSNPCREAEQSVSSHCCHDASPCIPTKRNAVLSTEHHQALGTRFAAGSHKEPRELLGWMILDPTPWPLALAHAEPSSQQDKGINCNAWKE